MLVQLEAECIEMVIHTASGNIISPYIYVYIYDKVDVIFK